MPPRPTKPPWQSHCDRWGKGCGSALCPKAHKIVLGRGQVPAQVMFVGEAPGVSEDVSGLPFVGPAGYLLDRIISKALCGKYTFAITNLVGCFPADESGSKMGEPDDDSVMQCSARLKEFYLICKPRLVIAVGKLSREWLTPGMKYSIKLGDSSHGIGNGVAMIDILHPAAILRMPLVQQGLAERRCVIQIQTALTDIEKPRVVTDNEGRQIHPPKVYDYDDPSIPF